MLDYIYGIVVKPIELLVEIIFSLMYKMFGNPGVAIIFVSVVIQLLVLPMYKKSDEMQEQEREKQKKMEHWVKHIKKTFKGDERFMMLQTYYRSENYKPFYAVKGSLSLLLQIPFFIAAYNYLSNLQVLKGASFIGIPDLGLPDGMLVLGTTAFNLLPILMTVFNIISGIIYTKGFPIKDKVQTYGLALVFLVLLYNSPSGLVLYWTLNNLFSLLKNIFLKLVKRPNTVLSILSAVVGICLFSYLSVTLGFGNKKKLCFMVLILVACLMPAVVSIIKKFFGDRLNQKKDETHFTDKTVNSIFTLSTVVMTLLLGVIVPMSVISVSPLEFVSANYGPIALMINTLAVFVGINLLWARIFYILSSPRGKRIFAYGFSAATIIGLINFYFFGRDLGLLSPVLNYEEYPVFSKSAMIGGVAVALAVVVAVAVLFWKRVKAVKVVYQIATLALVVLSATTIFSTYRVYQDTNARATEKASEGILPLSKNGQNVIVFMLDRAIGAYVPFLMAERPELEQLYDGFTFYPNTLSHGQTTNYCTPALFGGYEYVPKKINERKSETLEAKQNEALSVMPRLFSDNGYKVTITDPPYAGYQWVPDLSVFDGIKNTKAYITEGVYSGEMRKLYALGYESKQKRNFIFYSIMKACPVVAQNVIYNMGEYYSTQADYTVSEAFVSCYSVIQKLKDLTVIKNDGSNNFLMMQNSTTHNPVVLKKPEYEVATSDFGERLTKTGTTINGVTIKIENEEEHGAHYDTNMAVLLKIGEWLDYLREQGVYDNTRIIIVADHGRILHQLSNMDYKGIVDVEGFNPLLLVKDFNSHGFSVSNEFMTNADVPALATEGVISNPVNPFSGKQINSNDKSLPQMVTLAGKWNIYDSNGYTLNTEDGDWYAVKDNIFNINNWNRIGEGSRDE